jgi:exodeoxyribonuclease-5
MGDIAQLPPVMSEPNGLLDDPNYCLTEIVRQQEDNAIVKISADIRNGVPLQYGEYGNGQVRIINKAMIGHDNLIKEMLAADQVICGINVTRSRLNG